MWCKRGGYPKQPKSSLKLFELTHLSESARRRLLFARLCPNCADESFRRRRPDGRRGTSMSETSSHPRTGWSSICCPPLPHSYNLPLHTSGEMCPLLWSLLEDPLLVSDAVSENGDVCIYRLVSIKCSACFRLVSVSFAPLSMRAISWVRSVSSMRRTSVWVRPRFSVFSIRKC
jgi:hypothetical protein